MKEILIIIANEHLENKINDIINEFKITGIVKHKARGSSKESFWEFFNISREDKSIYFINIQKGELKKLKKRVEENKLFSKQNSGIMFNIKIGDRVMNGIEKNMVVSVVDYGYSSVVMKIARENGATGGTIFDAKGTGANFTSFLGVDINSEKEIVLNVVNENCEKKIIKAIKKHFKEENVSGICFSIPICNFVGINNK